MTTYISNGYYIFKFFQAFSAIVFLFLVFDTTKLCGEFLDQKSVRQAASIHKCSELTLYHLTLPNYSKPVDFQKLPPAHLRHIQPVDFPVGPNCLNISLGSSYKRCFTHPVDPHQMIADRFAVPIAFSITYLILHIVHTCVQMLPEYNSCQYMVVIFGAITWTISYVDMAILRTYWDYYWQCTNFLPQMPSIVDISLLITSGLVVSCVIEVLYNRDMMNPGRPNMATNNRKTSKTLGPVVNNAQGKGGGGGRVVNGYNNARTINCATADVKKQMEVFTIAVRY